MQIIQAISRKEFAETFCKKDYKDTLWVDTYNGAPLNMRKFRFFNPFFTWSEPLIPLPGMKEKKSKSVEAIWQGTKWIDEKTDVYQFDTYPYKRPSEKEREENKNYSYAEAQFLYDQKIIHHREARFLIYLVSYLYVMNYLVPDSIMNDIFNSIEEGHTIIFYDWDSNMDITNISESFSHSAILAAWFRKSLEEDFLRKAKEILSLKYYKIFSSQFYGLTTRYREQR